MVRSRRWVNKRTSCMTMEEAFTLTALGGKPRPDFATRPFDAGGRVKVDRVLCWWCREYHSPLEVDACMALPRKNTGTENPVSSMSSVLDAGPLKPLEELWAFLTASAFEDGTSRRTGRLSLCFESGNLKLSLNDEETGQYACLSGRQLQSLLEETELRLADGSMPWRASRFKSRKGG